MTSTCSGIIERDGSERRLRTLLQTVGNVREDIATGIEVAMQSILTDEVLVGRTQMHAEHLSQQVMNASESERLKENPFDAINRRVTNRRDGEEWETIKPPPPVPPRNRSESVASDTTSDGFIKYKMEEGWPIEESRNSSKDDSKDDESLFGDQILALEDFLDVPIEKQSSCDSSSPTKPSALLRVPFGDGQQITFDLGPVQESGVLTKSNHGIWARIRSLCSSLYASLLSLFKLDDEGPKKICQCAVVLAVFLLIGFGAARALGPLGRKMIIAVIQFVGTLSRTLE
eukprot:TRINITY_DN5458_c0_g2_i2.p1 TRINITY_DN5458_c0_g2~~TRINITY_DN5458_c0_g2_i2.p1  ORF type:complete len:287 (+),score=61.08 TRINITY_DN5458_c0_g2_i2:82-942(+)